ncbi:hypothetical protein E4P41_13735 [Geodermatophilus sp. DF01-2]|uniref:hypothetical protein n=1 Tax=Geodermatophilus sp. DF01-2 TaxID=2559610 RepID=UPI0010740321|nr:hypothetical protein [Geodermatophilus sp. DF01_2]TFV57919.1 hypothetical protein E4P41_13735 [Geodermatophilus sp. DF01_2]
MHRTTTRARLAHALLAGGLLVLPLAACTDGGAETDTGAEGPEITTDGGDTGAETTDPDPSVGAEDSADPTDATGSSVDCSGTTCSVTLTVQDRDVEVLGTTVALESSDAGRASFRVGNEELSCSQGESVSAGPLTLECTTVTDDMVTLSASVG